MERLNEGQRWTLINALRTAANASSEHAVALSNPGELGVESSAPAIAEAARGLIAQFTRQRQDYLAMAEQIEQAEYIELGDPELFGEPDAVYHAGDEAADVEPDYHSIMAGDAEPCCYGYVTSKGQVHEPGCNFFRGA